MTRINQKYTRAYMNGVDVSGYARTVGTLGWDFEVSPDTALSDGVKNSIVGKPIISADGLSSFLDNDAAGMFALAKAVATRTYLVAFGTNAAPVAGNPVFAWEFEQNSYKQESGEGFAVVSVGLGNASYAGELSYQKPWGYLLHASGAETGANTATGLDDNGAATTAGGIFIYHLLSSNGTVTLKMQDAATNLDGSFADVTGATSGSIDATTTPQYGMISLGTGATVRRYTRWQLALGTATTATFVMAFIRY
jgi:hypothetical protein